MFLLLNTSSDTCQLFLLDTDFKQQVDASWRAERQLADQLPGRIFKLLDNQQLKGIGVFRGPGSFTGLRIGCAVVNTIAYEKQVPIVGVQGDDWQKMAVNRLKAQENDRIVLPDYGRPANITKPVK